MPGSGKNAAGAAASEKPGACQELGKLVVLALLIILALLSIDATLFHSRGFERFFFRALILNLPLNDLCDRAFISSAISLGTLMAAGLFSWRRQTKETLWEGERLLSSIFASVQEGLIIKDAEFNIIRVNPVVEQWYAHEMPLVGKKCYQAFRGRQEPCEACPGLRALKTGQAAHDVVPKIGPGGEQAGWLDLYSFPLRDPATGRTSGVIEFLRDITEHTLAEEALKQSEEKYRLLVNQIPAVVFRGYGDWSVDFFDRKIEDLTGYSKEDFDSRKVKWRDLIPPEDFDYAQKMFIEALKTNKSYVREHRIRKKNGEIRWVQCRGQIFCNAAGEVDYISGVSFDITDRKQAEAARRESEERYRALVENIDLGINLIDANYRIIMTNAAMGRMFQKPASDFIHQECFREFEKREGVCSHCPGARAMATGLAAETETEGTRDDGSRFAVHIYAFPIFAPDGQVTGFIEVVEDITDRRQAEVALRESEQRYRLVVSNIPAVVFKGYLDWTIDLMDDKIEELTGYPKEDFNSRRMKWSDVILAEDLKGAQQVFLQALQTTRAYVREYRIRHKDGRILWIHARGHILCDIQGKMEYVSGVFFDVTEHKTAEEALRKSQASLAEAQRIAHIGNWEWDVPTDEIFWSDEVYRIFGLTPGQFESTYDAFLQAVHPDDRHLVQEAVNDALYQGKPYQTDHRILRPDGQERFVSERGEVTFDTAGRPLRLVGTVQDVTEIKQAQEAVQESESRYRLLAENVNDVIWTMDLDLRITYVSPSVRLFSGFTPEEAMALTVEELLTPPSLEMARSTLAEELALARQRPEAPPRSITLELEHRGKDGGTVWAEVQATFFRDAQGQLAGILGVTRDITGRKQLEEQLRQAQKMEVVGRLAGGVAHDFNNLLTAILGYCELLLVAVDEQAPERLDVLEIKRAGERAALLTRHLLAFSRRQVLQPKLLNLNEVIDNLGKMLKRVIGEDIELTILSGPELGMVMADPGQVEQVILNLAVNARDAMPRGGRLSIRTANADLDASYARLHAGVEPGPYVLLTVGDTGCGMDAATRANIFEPFFTTKETGKGTGLGLSMVYGVVKQSGGHIWVYSEPGQGTTFKIYLPRIDAVQEAAAGRRVAESAPQGRETILLVEDEEVVRHVAHRILQRQGYTVLDAKDGREALEVLEQHPGPVHLMLTDLVMPGMNGRELALKMRARHPEMKVLYMSGYAENGIVNQGVLEQGIIYIQKPFEARVLARRVRELLDASLPRH